MKRLLLLLLVSGGLRAIDTDIGKKPIVANNINSAVKDKYVIWTTEIKKNPKDDKPPMVTHAVKTDVSPSKQAGALNIKLNVPQKAVDFSTNMPGAAAEIAGAINPKAGAIASAAALIINEGLAIAGKELTKSYEKSPFDLTVIQIAPERYYRVVKNKDNPNGKIEITKAFKEDWKKWKQIKKEIAPTITEYNNALNDYNKAYRAHIARPNDNTLRRKAQDLYAKVDKLLDKKLKAEVRLKDYPLYRAAIMAVNPKEGNSCKVGYGPWQLHVTIYLGAKQTNRYVVDFCVPKKDDVQKFNINLTSDYHVAGTAKFMPGGIELATANNVTFPIFKDAETDFASNKSKLYDWYSEFITDTAGDSIDQFLFPFDVFKMEQEYAKKVKNKELKRSQTDIDRLKTAIEKLKSSKGKDELANSDDDGNVDSPITLGDDDNSTGGDTGSDDEAGYFSKLKDIKSNIDEMSSNEKELALFNKIADAYAEVLNAETIIKEEKLKATSVEGKIQLAALEKARTVFGQMPREILNLKTSDVKSSLETAAKELESSTKTSIEGFKKGETSTFEKIGSKAIDLLKEHGPTLLKSFFGSDKKKK